MAAQVGQKAVEKVAVGVVIERREIDNPWQDHSFRPVAVFAEAPALDPSDDWRQLAAGDGWVHFHAATLELELFTGETEGYKNNLSGVRPHVFVVLTPGEEADDPEVMPVLVTACPFEAESYTEDSEMIVEGVPMPDDVARQLARFVDAHHKEETFKKRKRKKAYDPRKADFRPRPLVDLD